MQTQKILVSGQVQGVGFRWSAKQLAQQLGVTGTVQNLPTGQVAIIASASTAVLRDFTHQLQHGLAPWIQVTDLEITDLPTRQFSEFHIII